MIRELLEPAGFTVEHVLGDTSGRGIAIARDPKGRRVLVTAIPPHDEAERIIAGVEAPLLDVVETLTLPGPYGGTSFVLTEALETGWSSLDPRWVAPAPYLVPRWCVALAELVGERESRAIIFRDVHPALVFVSSEPPWVHSFSQRAYPLTHLRERGGIDESGAVLRGLYEPYEGGPTLTADPFWLGGIVWRWRHGSGPFSLDFEGLARLRSGEPRPVPTSDVERLLAECFHPRGSQRPAIATIVEALRDDAWSVAQFRPPSATVRERIDAIARFFRERAAAGDLRSAKVSLEVVTTTDRTGEEIASHGSVSMTKPDGFGDAFRFSGDPDAIASTFARRVKPALTPPGRFEPASLPTVEKAVGGFPSSTKARKQILAELDDRVRSKLDARLSTDTKLRASLLGTKVTSTLEAHSTAFADLDTTTERHVSAIVVAIVVRLEAKSPPARLYGEEDSPADREDAILTDASFPWIPGDDEIDALVERSLDAALKTALR